MQKNVLISGISGFVGQNLVKYFNNQSDFKLYGLDIVFKEIEGVEEIYSWDHLNEIKDMDVVIHLAGKAHDLKQTSDEQSYFDVNYGLTKKIYDWFLGSTCSKFFLMSSVKAVADVVEGDFLTEKAIPAPITAYGRSKMKAEEYLLSKDLRTDQTYFIFRPSMIHGPNNKGNLNLLYSIVSKGFPWPLGAFDNGRSFVSIENLCFVFKEFIIENPQKGVYNIADNSIISTNQIVSLIYKSKGKKERIWKIPKNFIRVVAKIGGIMHFSFNSERLQKLTEDYKVSNQKLKSVLKKDFPIIAIDGMKFTIDSFNKLDNNS